jgi:type I restriction enzyme S subunit
MPPAILPMVFRAALVPQDPHDEPASALLERIRTQRSNNHESRPKKRL